MYDYGYGYDYGTADYESAAGLIGGMFAGLGVVLLILSVVGILMLISQWKIYKKAGYGGWECLIPIYNIIVLLKIVKLPTWYIALFIVPIANIYVMFKIYIELAHKFGKSTGFGVATAFFGVVCLPILAFGKDNVYQDEKNMVSTNDNMQNNQYNPVTFENQFNLGNNEMNYNNQMTPNPVPYNMNDQINPVPQPVVPEPQFAVNQQPTPTLVDNGAAGINAVSNLNNEVAPQVNTIPVMTESTPNEPQPVINNQPTPVTFENQMPEVAPDSNINNGTMPQEEPVIPEPVVIGEVPQQVVNPQLNTMGNIQNQTNPLNNNPNNQNM